jgi:plasmid maintenance system antidote protein VapI
MLATFRSLNESFREVNVSTDTTMYKLVSGSLLKTLMGRTGTGERITVRELAAKVGVPHGTIGALTSGAQQLLPEATAKKVAAAIGVDYLVLWIPMERAGRLFNPAQVAV